MGKKTFVSCQQSKKRKNQSFMCPLTHKNNCTSIRTTALLERSDGISNISMKGISRDCFIIFILWCFGGLSGCSKERKNKLTSPELTYSTDRLISEAFLFDLTFVKLAQLITFGYICNCSCPCHTFVFHQ